MQYITTIWCFIITIFVIVICTRLQIFGCVVDLNPFLFIFKVGSLFVYIQLLTDTTLTLCIVWVLTVLTVNTENDDMRHFSLLILILIYSLLVEKIRMTCFNQVVSEMSHLPWHSAGPRTKLPNSLRYTTPVLYTRRGLKPAEDGEPQNQRAMNQNRSRLFTRSICNRRALWRRQIGIINCDVYIDS